MRIINWRIVLAGALWSVLVGQITMMLGSPFVISLIAIASVAALVSFVLTMITPSHRENASVSVEIKAVDNASVKLTGCADSMLEMFKQGEKIQKRLWELQAIESRRNRRDKLAAEIMARYCLADYAGNAAADSLRDAELLLQEMERDEEAGKG